MESYSLILFRSLLDRMPPGLPDEIFQAGQDNYFELQISYADDVETEQAILVYGKQVWAYRQAALEFEEVHGAGKRENFFTLFLTTALKEKWEKFISEGGDIHNFKNPDQYENFFEPEEDLAIEEAFVESSHITDDYLDRLSKSEKKSDFKRILEKYQREQDLIEKKIEELRMIVPEEGEKWVEEIQKEASFFELGLADVEERPTVEKVQGKIDFYRGQVDTGNL
ncbi:MAG: hypothetical protein ABII02_03235 [Candidatus Magasanikbacteria bacterium]